MLNRTLAVVTGLFAITSAALVSAPTVSGTVSSEQIVSREGSFAYVAALTPNRKTTLGWFYELRGDDSGEHSRLTVTDWRSVPLDKPHSAHGEIREKGDGRYSHWGNHLYFSTIGNVALPADFQLLWMSPATPKSFLIWLWALTSIAALTFLWMRFNATPVAYLIGAILVLLFFLARLPIYTGYLVPYYSPDSGSYFDIAYRIASGEYPLFAVRTPGYPLFLWVALTVTERVTAIVLLQQLATLISGLLLYWALIKIGRWLAIAAGIAVAGYFLAGDVVLYETALAPEALYGASLVFTIAFLVRGITTRRSAWFGLASAAMAFAIALKPAALFLPVLVVLLVAGLYALKYPRACSVAVSIPLIVIALSIAVYNRITLGQFTVTPWGSVNLIAATSTFWVESSMYPESARRAVATMRTSIMNEDRKTLENSWDPEQLWPVYDRYYNLSVYGVLGKETGFNVGDAKTNALFKQISVDAIREHPLQYAKFVFTNAYFFFWKGPQTYHSYNTFLSERYQRLFEAPQTAFVSRNDDLTNYSLREFAQPAPLPNFRRTTKDGQLTYIPKMTTAFEIHDRIASRYYPTIFNGELWFWIFITLLASVVLVWLMPNARIRASAALLSGSSVCLALLGAGVLVALVEMGLDRYAHPTRFIYFLSLPLILWLLASTRRPPGKNQEQSAPHTEG